MKGVPVKTTHWATHNERLRRHLKITRKSYNKLYMSKNIHARLYIKFIITVFIVRVLSVITQVYNNISKGSSVVRASSRYGRRCRIDCHWLQLLCIPASCWVSRFLWPGFLWDTISSKGITFLLV